MYSRWFNVAVIVLWLSTMGWLVHEKVLPPLLVGEPPSYCTILEAQRCEPPVGWQMSFNGRKLGWALNTMRRLPGDLTEVHSHIHFDQLPIRDMTPGWLRAFIRLIEQPAGRLCMDTESTLVIDPLGRLSRFESSIRLDSAEEIIHLEGTVDGSQLELSVRSGDFSYTTESNLPPNALLGDSLSPQTQLPGLRIGQTWTVPSYSLFRPPKNPMEILEATVERIDRISYNGNTQNTYLVVYRTDPGMGLGGNRTVRGKLWVRRDGAVLKQQVMLFDSTMTFVRLSEDEALALQCNAKPRPLVADNPATSR